MEQLDSGRPVYDTSNYVDPEIEELVKENQDRGAAFTKDMRAAKAREPLEPASQETLEELVRQSLQEHGEAPVGLTHRLLLTKEYVEARELQAQTNQQREALSK